MKVMAVFRQFLMTHSSLSGLLAAKSKSALIRG